MIDYLCYVKKQYSKEKEYEKFLVGLTILMLIGYLITGDNLNLLFIFGGLSIMYIFGIPFITYRRERKQGIVEKKKEYIKKEFLAEEFECMVLCQYLVQVKMRNFSHFNPPEAQPQCVFFYTIVRIHLVTYSYNGYEFVSYCRKLPDIRKSSSMPACNREF